jgi:hypothetical protein
VLKTSGKGSASANVNLEKEIVKNIQNHQEWKIVPRNSEKL